MGECLNYNAYGANLADLHFHPAELYLRMQPYTDPLAFCAQAPELDALRRASADDLKQAIALPIENVGDDAVVVFMPEAAWSRRVAGTFANELSRRHANRTVALLVRSGAGFQVSLRAPEHGSAGIQFLPESDVARLLALLRHPFAGGARGGRTTSP